MFNIFISIFLWFFRALAIAFGVWLMAINWGNLNTVSLSPVGFSVGLLIVVEAALFGIVKELQS